MMYGLTSRFMRKIASELCKSSEIRLNVALVHSLMHTDDTVSVFQLSTGDFLAQVRTREGHYKYSKRLCASRETVDDRLLQKVVSETLGMMCAGQL